MVQQLETAKEQVTGNICKEWGMCVCSGTAAPVPREGEVPGMLVRGRRRV